MSTDISCLPDLGRIFAFKSGKANLGEALARRLQTPRGGLHYAPNYGTDLRALLNEAMTPAQVAAAEAAIEAECEKDPRVRSASATVTVTGSRVDVAIEIEPVDEDETFVLQLAPLSTPPAQEAPVTFIHDSTADGTMTGPLDGVNASFTLSKTPLPAFLQVFVNGILELRWTRSGKVITFNADAIPQTGQIDAYYHV